MIYTVPERDPELGYIDTWLWLPKSRIAVETLRRSLRIPILVKDQLEHIECWRESKHHLGVPRCRIDPVGLPYDVVDLRPIDFERVNIRSGIELDALMPERDEQYLAYTDVVSSTGGILNLSCGKGKTVVMLHCIAKWGVPTLIINDKVHILQQWKKRIAQFLEVDSIGWVQGKPEKWDWHHPITMASLKTLTMYHDQVPPEMTRYFGAVVWDEIHHLAALGFSRTAHLFIGNRYGATATTKRADGNQVVYYWHVGREVHINKTQDLIPVIKVVESLTEVDQNHPDCLDISGNIHPAKLTIHVARQEEELALGVKYAEEARSRGRDLVAVSTSKEHARRLSELVPNSGVIDADVDPNLREDVLADHKVTFGTIHILSEAIDKQSLDSLLILMEFTSEIWMEQAVGRIQRLLEGKKEVRVIMIWHSQIPKLRKRGLEMMRLFREMGYKVVK